MDRIFFALGSAFGAAAVGLGAFGAHALRERLSDDLMATFETGVRYQFYHVFAILAVAYAAHRWSESKLPPVAGWCFVAGVVIFSGSLYLLVLTGARWYGAITPIGGVALIVGWLCLGAVAWKGN